MKEPKCKICGGPHYKSFCFQAPRKPLKVNKPLKRTPIKRKPTKIKQKSDTLRARKASELDKIFSAFIRQRGAIGGFATCFTCGYRALWQELQNGHYMARRYFSTRWDELNCNVQCNDCNVTKGGNLKIYRQKLIAKYGLEAVEALERKARHTEKVTTQEIVDKIEYYRKKVL